MPNVSIFARPKKPKKPKKAHKPKHVKAAAKHTAMPKRGSAARSTGVKIITPGGRHR